MGDERKDILRTVLADRVHAVRDLLAGDVLIYEDCLMLVDAILAGGTYSITDGWVRIVYGFPIVKDPG